MGELSWPQNPPPAPGPDPPLAWTGSPETPIDLAVLRRRLRRAAAAGFTPPGADDDDIEWLLLTFEELSSNALRHGRPPARVVVTLTATGWLVEASDAAPDRPPAPAVGRDAALGGLGLHLVARLCGGHGWLVEPGRKRVWAHVVCAAAQPTDGVTHRLRDEVTALTTALPGRSGVCITGVLDDLREDVVSDLFTALREALRNVTRHAGAHVADVDVTVTAGVLTLQVRDDGIGMQAAPRDGGLADLRRRATCDGGTLSVEPGPVGGTRLTWTARAHRRTERREPDGSQSASIRPHTRYAGCGPGRGDSRP
jgi:anti-sigma regulatory factor (Ser/Thr protein kinase)